MLGARTLKLTPSDLGRTVEVADDAGTPLATARGGDVRSAAGEPLLRLAVHKPSGARRDRPTEVSLGVADAEGRSLGGARIVKYGFGPRARKLSLVLVGPDGAEAGRLEPVDDRGERVSATEAGAEVATVAIEQVKLGFLRKARIYHVLLGAEPSPLLLATLVGYEALLQSALAATMRD